ncbi:histidine phosphatase family protein [Candidatus Micrarchaeota archaeon]|nr:histidine phosphatase family protein [Candidatus Micrarchaeota archaeon]
MRQLLTNGSKKMIKILLIRHGLTNYNLEEKIQGSLETKLHSHGLKQAKDLAKRLKSEKIDAIYSSSLLRAITTANEVLKFHPKLKLQKIPGLNERNYGEFEGIRYLPASKKEPRLFARINHVDMNFFPKKGESWMHVKKRVMRSFREILKNLPNLKNRPSQTIAIVAHGGVNRVILSTLIGLPLHRMSVFKQNNACVNILEIDGQRVRIALLNDTGHTLSEY